MRQAGKPEPINNALKQHSVEADDWPLREAAALLHDWADRFNDCFELGLETPAIRIEKITRCHLGTYREGRNGFGLRHEITMNARHLERPPADQLCTLLHELIHEWQALYGTAGRHNYHNRQFRAKAALYGLIVDQRGHDLGVRAGRFTKLLSEHEVDTACLRSPEEQNSPARLQGQSKMRKYWCGCTIARCATDLQTTCNKCGLRFEEAAPNW